MTAGKLVVVLDRQPETAEVLSAILAPRGVRVARALVGGAAASLPATTVAVLDEDTVREQGLDPGDWVSVPRVILGTLRLDASSPAHVATGVRLLSKPYHYGDLIRAVEALIARAAD